MAPKANVYALSIALIAINFKHFASVSHDIIIADRTFTGLESASFSDSLDKIHALGGYVLNDASGSIPAELELAVPVAPLTLPPVLIKPRFSENEEASTDVKQEASGSIPAELELAVPVAPLTLPPVLIKPRFSDNEEASTDVKQVRGHNLRGGGSY